MPVAHATRVTDVAVASASQDTPAQDASAIVLVQQDPHPGEPTPYHTLAAFHIDRHTLSLRVFCADPDPTRIVTHSIERDRDQTDDDHITLVIDPFGTNRVAYVFEVNARGGRRDGLISPASTAVSYDWNGDWTALVTRKDSGWNAEVSIDTRALQFPVGGERWHINLRRYVPREQLSLQWTGISLDASIFDLARTGVLDGVSVLEPARGWSIAPSLTGRYTPSTRNADVQAGIDVRYQLSPELTALATINPDFAEAEADAEQLNLTRFQLFRPEKRDFFLEGSNLFGFASGLDGVFSPFYSRRIGIQNGSIDRIDSGTKVIGQIDGLSLGALDVQTARSIAAGPANLFVGRVADDVDDSLRIGTLITHGDPSGQVDNTFAGVDAVWHTATFLGDKNLSLSGWLAGSSGNLVPGTPVAGGIYADSTNDRFRWVASTQVFGAALNPALGFLPRPGTEHVDLYGGYYARPGDSWIRRAFFETEFEQYTGLDGHPQTRQLTLIPLNLYAESGMHLELHGLVDDERLAAPFAISPGVALPAGAYTFDRLHAQVESPAANPLHVGISIETGTFYDGRLRSSKPYATYSGLNGALRLEFANETDWGRLRQGRFVQRLSQFRVAYSPTPDINLSTFAQRDSGLGSTALNAQLRWNYGTGKDLFVILNHGSTQSPSDPDFVRQAPGNTIFVKFSWAYRR